MKKISAKQKNKFDQMGKIIVQLIKEANNNFDDAKTKIFKLIEQETLHGISNFEFNIISHDLHSIEFPLEGKSYEWLGNKFDWRNKKGPFVVKQPIIKE